MRINESIQEVGLITELNNFKNAFIISFYGNSKFRKYKREHNKRLSTNQFIKLKSDLLSYDFIQDRFKFLDNIGFKVTE